MVMKNISSRYPCKTNERNHSRRIPFAMDLAPRSVALISISDENLHASYSGPAFLGKPFQFSTSPESGSYIVSSRLASTIAHRQREIPNKKAVAEVPRPGCWRWQRFGPTTELLDGGPTWYEEEGSKKR